MKKIIALLLALTLCMGLFAGCDLNNTKPTEAPVTVDDAAEYLYAMYKDNNNTVVRKDFKRVAAVMIDGVKFDVEWTVDSSEVTIGAVENSMVTIDINEAPTEKVVFNLTATVKASDGSSKAVVFTHTIEAAKKTGVEFAAAPVAGTAYKFALEQVSLGQIRYFTGAMDGYYLATSDNPFDAVDVFVEDVTGGQRIYFMNGDVKTYIDVIPREGAAGKVNVVMTENPTATFVWDAVRKTFTTVVEGNTWYLGTYGTNKTISASNISYIEKPEVIGDSQFPAGFCTVNIVAEQIKTPAVNTAYKFALVQAGLGQTRYFTGAMDGYYLATSVNPAEGVNVFIEEVTGGHRIYFMKGEVKTYIDVIPREGAAGKVNVVMTENPTATFVWDAERNTYTTVVEGNTWYLGTYGTNKTISASNISYIEKPEVIGDSQFPAGPYTVEGFMDKQPEFKEETPDVPAVKEPAADSTLSVKDAIALGASKESNVYTAGKYYVVGEITEIYNEQYGNMKIKDAEGNILTVYGTWSADGNTRFDALEKKPAVGDTIKVYGIIGQYNGTPQMKNGWITEITGK